MSAEQERSSRYPALPRDECRELLTSTTVGRIAFVGSRGLTVRPVNYRLDGERVLVRTSTDSVLAELVDHAGEVVFEVDHHGAAVRRGWSVLARGRAASVAESEVDDEVLARLRPWADGDHAVLLGIGLDELTGRHVAFHD